MKKSAIAAAICYLLLSAAPVVYAQHSAEAQGSGEAASHEKGSSHKNEPGIVWKWANFAILVGALGYLVAKKAPAFFQSRTEEIQRGIREAKAAREQAEAQAADFQRRLDNLPAEIEQLKRSAQEELAAEEARLRTETEQAARKIQERSELELAAAVKAARLELKAQSAELAIELARKKIYGGMTAQTDGRLVQAFLSDLGRRGQGQAGREVS
ncbi:MAG: hypothetical protein ABFD89_19040 [Bryobacteraceae bacterium]